VAGGAYVAGGSTVTTSNSHTHTYHGNSSTHSVSGDAYAFGIAGVAWNGASSSSNASDKYSNDSSQSSSSWGKTGYDNSGSYDHQTYSASVSLSDKSSESQKFSAKAKWSFSNDVDSTDVTTTGSITKHIDTRTPGELDAGTGNNAASGVNGNLGVNVAEGIDNAQSNDVALASVDVGNVFGNAQIFSSQSSSGKAAVNNFKLNATVGDYSLSNVSGNVGVNVASGIGNVQNNSLAGAVTTVNPTQVATVAMAATDDNTQTASAQATGRFEGSATLGANTLNASAGNIGVNIAGGVGNLQHNGLAIAALNNGH